MIPREFRLYDTLTNQVKPLVPQEPGHLKFYTCGPTVYSYAHIGNFRSFLTADLVVRTARALGWRVTWVTNITDVGHLTEDQLADAAGEDKMERALRSKEGERFHNIWELSEYYTSAYQKDWERLNLVEPTIRPKATQHVREQILAAEELVEKGYAYRTESGVYFRVDQFPDYGKLSGNTQDKLREAVRDVVVDESKQSQADFAIWKSDDRHLMQWHSPFGWGFPGWHIECSVMARAYLGDTLDLHSGGEDNIFPHHECEIAQSEALTGKPFSRHWVHTRFLFVNGKKMSKSEGNFYTVRDLVARGYSPLAIRYALISGVYSKNLNFTDQGLRDAGSNVERLQRAWTAAEAAAVSDGASGLADPLAGLYDEALDAMTDDLNTAIGLAKFLEGAKLISRQNGLDADSRAAALQFMEQMNALLGVARSDYGGEPEAGPAVATIDGESAEVDALIEERAAAKKAKDFARADAIRDALLARGIELRDSPEGTTWSRRPG
ncbi:MAG: cysteine--tRNA ligase [Fimbriimonadaceae bacterium]|nr:cysteine--tRNA ligase [Fimbriimonadaceae bacterium]